MICVTMLTLSDPPSVCLYTVFTFGPNRPRSNDRNRTIRKLVNPKFPPVATCLGRNPKRMSPPLPHTTLAWIEKW